MTKPFTLQFNDLGLKKLSNRLQEAYYDSITSLCNKTEAQVKQLKESDDQQIARYANTCTHLLQQVNYYLNDRRQALAPYIDELYDKNATGHNCSTCSGSCDMGHKAQLFMLQESHVRVYDLLYQLQGTALPLYEVSGDIELYKTIRYEILLMDAMLKELFFVEEAYLVPEIIKSQRNINVNS